jgi:alpha-tubulin suppressor-like RCC1 family protein
MMASSGGADLRDFPLEVLTHVCRHLGLCDLVRVSQTCTRFRHGGLETVELPTESPVVAVPRELAFPRDELVPRTRPVGCTYLWVAYLARCTRQRRCREAPPIAIGVEHSLFADASGRLLACGRGAAVGHGDEEFYFDPTPVAAMVAVRVRSVAAGSRHSLALGWDGRVYSWGDNYDGQLGHGNKDARPSPALVEELEGACGIAAYSYHCLAVTQSGGVFSCGESLQRGAQDKLWPAIVEGFGGVRVRRVRAGEDRASDIGQDGELFSWDRGTNGLLGHGDAQDQPSPKRVEALRSGEQRLSWAISCAGAGGGRTGARLGGVDALHIPGQLS